MGARGPRLPGGGDELPGADAAVVVDDEGARSLRWAGAEPVTVLYGAARGYVPVEPSALDDGSGVWVPSRLIVNRPLTVPTTGEELDTELFDVSELRAGPDDPGAHWWRDDGVVQLRIPWALLGFSDPSSRRALLVRPDGTTGADVIDAVELVVRAGGEAVRARYSWDEWNEPRWSDRYKDGVAAVAEALVASAEGS